MRIQHRRSIALAWFLTALVAIACSISCFNGSPQHDAPFLILGALLIISLPVSIIVLGPLYRARKVLEPPPDLCKVCGYDLRATPHRCPECGTVPLPKSK